MLLLLLMVGILFGHLKDTEAKCLQQDLGFSRLDIKGEACRDFSH